MERTAWWTAFIAALLTATIGSMLAYRALAYTKAFEEADAAAAHATDLIETTDSALIAILDAQRGLRGYLITRDERFLDEWDRGAADLPRQLERLRQLSEGRAHTRKDVEALTRHAESAMAFGREGLALARAGQWQEVQDRVRSGEGKRRMDETRRLIDSLKGGAKFERDMRRRIAHHMASVSLDAARGLVLLASGIATVLAILGWHFMRRRQQGVPADDRNGKITGRSSGALPA